MLKQLSVFAKNQRGEMASVLNTLADANITIRASVTNESGEYGTIRMIVSEPDKAADILKDKGFMFCLTDVLGVELSDEPGSMAKMTQVLDDMNINIDYIYLSYNRGSARPVLIVHCEYIQETEESLKSQGYILQ